MKYHHTYFSPHFDDVVLSCGGTLAKQAKKGEKALVTTVFTKAKNKPVSKFALNFVKGCDFENPQKLFKARIIEDNKAAKILGFKTLRLRYQDAVFRIKKSTFFFYKFFPRWQFLYSSPENLVGGKINKADNFLRRELLRKIKTLIKKYAKDNSIIYFPLAIGGHIDHQILHQIGLKLAQTGRKALFYEDFPYLTEESFLAKWVDKSQDSFSLKEVVDIKSTLGFKTRAINAYKSQIKMLFGGEKFTLPSQERFWSAR